jgi:hypothetical protein
MTSAERTIALVTLTLSFEQAEHIIKYLKLKK